MKRATFVILAVLLIAAQSAFAGNVRISQVYGGGGSSGTTAPLSTYQQDYIELFNSSGVAVNVGGWILAYGSATGAFSCTNCTQTIPDNTMVPACGYLLIACGSAGTTGLAVPNPDVTIVAGPSMSANNGKIALLSVGPPGTGTCPGGTVEDLVGYGTANCSETSPTAGLLRNTMAVRNNGGLTDTDNNLADFTIVTDAVPHNSASPINPGCTPVGVSPSSWGTVKGIYR